MELKDVQLAEQQCIDVVKTLEDDFKLYGKFIIKFKIKQNKVNK